VAEVPVRVSTTLLMSLAAVAMAVVAMLGEDGAFTPLTVTMALVGLVPWALVAGGVRLPPWLFLLLAVPPGVVIVVVSDNPGGMFPLMLAVVWLTRISRSAWLPAIAVTASFLAILETTFSMGSADDSGIVYFTGGLGISWLSGLLLRRQDALTAQLEAMRDAQVEQLAASERARIAREVHDVVAHSLTVVMLNLTGARRALASDPERADEALARAEVVGRDSLDSIRQVMGLLRESESVAALPQPAIDGIAELVDGYRRAGLGVELSIGAVACVDATVELVIYRLVQESLANVLQHAPGATATVALADDGDGVGVRIENGPATAPEPPASERTGLGRRGMSERVRAVGGRFESRATQSGGWLVSAWLPARDDAPAAIRHG
jgi:signal transduction histidine kinase